MEVDQFQKASSTSATVCTESGIEYDGEDETWDFVDLSHARIIVDLMCVRTKWTRLLQNAASKMQCRDLLVNDHRSRPILEYEPCILLSNNLSMQRDELVP